MNTLSLRPIFCRGASTGTLEVNRGQHDTFAVRVIFSTSAVRCFREPDRSEGHRLKEIKAGGCSSCKQAPYDQTKSLFKLQDIKQYPLRRLWIVRAQLRLPSA